MKLFLAILSIIFIDKANAQFTVKYVNDQKLHNDSINESKPNIFPESYNSPGDHSPFNDSERLRNDLQAYNIKNSVWIPALHVTGTNIFIWAVDRNILDKDYSIVGTETWKNNLQAGWEWDEDRFAPNFLGHPYSGGLFFNAARSNGYNYFQSIPFAVSGSLLWEYFGENQVVSKSDVVTSSVNGPFFGEILYRLSSNILDERTTGAQRLFRELAAGFINPVRGVNRLMQGRTKRKVADEIYQKEPLAISVFTGVHGVNDGGGFRAEHTDAFFNITINYGDPFEKRFRKPFDLFHLETDITLGAGRRFFDNLQGFGILTGKNMQMGNLEMLVGAFQHYEYRNNKTVELSSFALSGGILSKLAVYRETELYSTIFLGAIPLAGNSTHLGTFDSEHRDYNYGGGAEGGIETKINFGNGASIFFQGYYYWIHTYHGFAGDNFMKIIRTGIAIKVFNNVQLGVEHSIYFDDRYSQDIQEIHLSQGEQKMFLLFNFD